MTVSVISNVINIGGNAALIWGFNMGVAGAAIATLASRVFCAVVVLWQLRMDRQPIVVRNYRQIRRNGKMIRRVLALGIPSGIENSHVSAWKAGNTVFRIYIGNGSHCSSGNDEYP